MEYNCENKKQKYDSKELSLNNINFILKGNKNKSFLYLKSPKILNNIKKIISFDYIEQNPYSRISHVYSVPNTGNYNLVCTSDPMKNKKMYNINGPRVKSINNKIYIPITRNYSYNPYNMSFTRSFLEKKK